MLPSNIQALAFPRLDETQMAQLARCVGDTALRQLRAGETIYETGDRDYGFFVIRAGEIEVEDLSGDASKVVTVHGPGQFTGEVAQLTGAPSLVTAVARCDSEVYAISPDALRDVLNRLPDLGDLIVQAFIARRQLLREEGTFTGVRVLGSRYAHDTFRIRDFLAKNRMPFTWLDLESDPEVRTLLERFGVGENDTPVVAWGQRILRNPSNRELADALGIRQPTERVVYDLVVIGAGPAGLAAAVYGASEGLRTLVIERDAPGGQASSSMRIENYLGFPTGITGRDLADRAVLQADRFGARIAVSTPAVGLSFEDAYAILTVDGGDAITARTVLIATGAEYRRLDIEGCSRFEGCGVYYAATPIEAMTTCRGGDVVVVGGGNSAGQAAVFLSTQVHEVFLVVRASDLRASMSAYLARRIEETPNIEVLLDSTVSQMDGEHWLRSVEVVNHRTGATRTFRTPALFSFIGVAPRTDWLPPAIKTDARGFIVTGPPESGSRFSFGGRQPFLLETNHPGVFAAGDVRAGSTKRVASAVGEGAMTVRFVHEYLKER